VKTDRWLQCQFNYIQVSKSCNDLKDDFSNTYWSAPQSGQDSRIRQGCKIATEYHRYLTILTEFYQNLKIQTGLNPASIRPSSCHKRMRICCTEIRDLRCPGLLLRSLRRTTHPTPYVKKKVVKRTVSVSNRLRKATRKIRGGVGAPFPPYSLSTPLPSTRAGEDTVRRRNSSAARERTPPPLPPALPPRLLLVHVHLRSRSRSSA
jgi:hypothetical protein